jgi:hypothetical protein
MNLRDCMRNGVVLVLLIWAPLATVGCEGSDTRATVDDTAQELAGKKNLDRYQQMRGDLAGVQQRQAHQYRQLEESADTD